MRKVLNETTGIEEIQFGGKLISISDKVSTNVNGKNYKVATIDFEDASGNQQRCTSLVYEGNYSKGVVVGETYLCTATPTDNGVIVKMSHLTFNGDRATVEMFGFDAVAETAKPAMQPNPEFDKKIF